MTKIKRNEMCYVDVFSVVLLLTIEGWKDVQKQALSHLQTNRCPSCHCRRKHKQHLVWTGVS